MNTIDRYERYLVDEERSKATVEKYIRDIRKFFEFLSEDKCVNKEIMIAFKNHLLQNYKISSVNSILVAVNNFLSFSGLMECRVKQFRLQKNLFCRKDQELTKEDYQKLVQAARLKDNERLSLLMQTICSTGIRVSEHRFISVEALKQGYAVISNKGKTRTIFLTPELSGRLKVYCSKKHIESGAVFITKSGKPLDRSNIWTMMKALCRDAGVDPKKVYPHNLRHLFAFTFYGIEKDLLRLADILGHSSIETTRICTISSGVEHKRILSKLNLLC
ncbi:tyrosine-type recombinase/integrase [Clostridium sp. MCC353]|nr:tyrosine-type recombinase/integrase [Clostridium sp. MCC353]MBT9778522.1 tyrosine-type recombinase/integrase [Clostridium sp. MCC353]